MKIKWYVLVVLVVVMGLVVGCASPVPIGPTATPSLTPTKTVTPLPTNTATPAFTATPTLTSTPTATPEPDWVLPMDPDGTFNFADMSLLPEITPEDYTSGRWQAFIRQSGLTHPYDPDTVCAIPWRQVDLKQPYQPDIAFSLDLRPVIPCVKPGMDFFTQFPVDVVAGAIMKIDDWQFHQLYVMTMQVWSPEAPDGYVLITTAHPYPYYEGADLHLRYENCPTCYRALGLTQISDDSRDFCTYINYYLHPLGLYPDADVMYDLIATWDELEYPSMEMERWMIAGWDGFY